MRMTNTLSLSKQTEGLLSENYISLLQSCTDKLNGTQVICLKEILTLHARLPKAIKIDAST